VWPACCSTARSGRCSQLWLVQSPNLLDSTCGHDSLVARTSRTLCTSYTFPSRRYHHSSTPSAGGTTVVSIVYEPSTAIPKEAGLQLSSGGSSATTASLARSESKLLHKVTPASDALHFGRGMLRDVFVVQTVVRTSGPCCQSPRACSTSFLVDATTTGAVCCRDRDQQAAEKLQEAQRAYSEARVQSRVLCQWHCGGSHRQGHLHALWPSGRSRVALPW
jgi:hypothetical protein